MGNHPTPAGGGQLVFSARGASYHFNARSGTRASGHSARAAAALHERANGRLFKRLAFALPPALSAAEQQEVAVGFARHLTAPEQLPYTLVLSYFEVARSTQTGVYSSK